MLVPGYEIHSLIGRGGMGAVYHAWQRSLKRNVAIKVLPQTVDDGEMSFASRFRAEAESMARLNHPGIISVYDAGETPSGLLYIVMEYVQGTDVARMIATAGRLPPEHAHAIAANVCDALSYAHAHGLIHRDIKPANIMVDSQGRVKVADFGLAKAVNEENGFTRPNMAVGTPHFLAPEAMIPGLSIDGRADLYAVGVMLYQMLTGEIPRGAWETPSHLVPGIDPRFDEIVVKAMRVDRESRHSDAAELRTHLDTLLIPAPRPDPVAAPHAPSEENPIHEKPAQVSTPSRSMMPILAFTTLAITASVAFIFGKGQTLPATKLDAAPASPSVMVSAVKAEGPELPLLKLPDTSEKVHSVPIKPTPKPSPASASVTVAPSRPSRAAAAPVLIAQANTASPLGAPAAPATVPQLNAPAELTALQQQYYKLLAEKVTGIYEAAITQLNTGYTGGLDRGMAEAQKSGQLDAVLAFEEEKEHVTAEQTIPATDDDKTPDTLRKLRAIYRTSAAKLATERSTNQTALVVPFAARLKQLETDFTKQGRIPDAKVVKAYREELGSAISTSPPKVALSSLPTSPTPVPTTSTTGVEVVSRPKPTFTYKGKAYWVTAEKADFDTARARCLSMGGKLTSVHEIDITKAIAKKISDSLSEVWVDGTYDSSTGGYFSSDRHPIERVRLFEVDERGGVANSRLSLMSKGLRATGSTRLLGFICEWPE